MKVLIYSSNRLFGECLEQGLAQNADVEWVGFAADVPCAVKLAGNGVEVSLLFDMTCVNIPVVLDALRKKIRIESTIALAVDICRGGNLVRCVNLGFQGFVPIETPLKDVPGIIRAAGRGEVRLAPKATAGLLRELRERSIKTEDLYEGLTRRERDVCQLVCDGLTNKEIALEMNRSIGTVKNHIHAILSKLDVPRRAAIPRRYLHESVANRI